MKQKAQRTVPVACRIFPQENEVIVKAAAHRGMSRAQFITHLLSRTEYVADQHQAEQHQAVVTKQLEAAQQQLQQAQAATWMQEPYQSLLQVILCNDLILKELYTVYGDNPIPTKELHEKGFQPQAMLTGRQIENRVFKFCGSFGWSHADASKKNVIISKQV